MYGKLYGENLNEIGNFTLVGHNYDKVFKRLEELNVGDEFYIQDIKSCKEGATSRLMVKSEKIEENNIEDVTNADNENEVENNVTSE